MHFAIRLPETDLIDRMIRIVAGTYEGLLYGWELPTSGEAAEQQPAKMKLTFGYSAHSECIKSVALMAAKQGKTLLSGSADEMIKCVGTSSVPSIGLGMVLIGDGRGWSSAGSTT